MRPSKNRADIRKKQFTLKKKQCTIRTGNVSTICLERKWGTIFYERSSGDKDENQNSVHSNSCFMIKKK